MWSEKWPRRTEPASQRSHDDQRRRPDSNAMTKFWGLRWGMIGLLMLGSIINYLTRSTLAVAAPTVLKDLDITTQQYSWILSAFQFAIMLQPLCGYVMDSVGLKLGFAIFAVAWSFVSMAHGLAGNWQTI